MRIMQLPHPVHTHVSSCMNGSVPVNYVGTAAEHPEGCRYVVQPTATEQATFRGEIHYHEGTFSGVPAYLPYLGSETEHAQGNCESLRDLRISALGEQPLGCY